MQITQYLRDVRAELRHVRWPSKATTITLTTIVVILSIATALYLGIFDFFFSEIIQSLI
ncbi:MAG: preprotein translocase subunit SecE [Patescibacteria group bacterium]